MYLVDTNIFRAILLSQDIKEPCKTFLDDNIGHISISDFSLHSIGVILFRNNKDTIFLEFTKDVIHKVEIITLQKSLYEDLAQDKKAFGLDFDDLYQYKIAKQRDLKIVTMDKDFEKVKKEIEIIFL